MSVYIEIKNEYTHEEKKLYWELGNGLQSVDGMRPSSYLINLQSKEISGEITLDDVKADICGYYEMKEEVDLTEKEADYSSVGINEYMRNSVFVLHPLTLKQIHRAIFKDLEWIEPGEYRTYNISKAESVLHGQSVRYDDWRNIKDFLEYDIDKELKAAKKRTVFDLNEFVDFITGIWQIHPFKEGNTRSVAVFAIQYLKSLGFSINYKPFIENAKGFREALVKACYNNMKESVSPDHKYINKFFEEVIGRTVLNENEFYHSANDELVKEIAKDFINRNRKAYEMLSGKKA